MRLDDVREAYDRWADVPGNYILEGNRLIVKSEFVLRQEELEAASYDNDLRELHFVCDNENFTNKSTMLGYRLTLLAIAVVVIAAASVAVMLGR